jgi:alkanesulfonate monooxygenase SsuD/methylene tetrahydromethanopterin reductase-like flavin-dependent oxidoreductase (luciferase family)
MEFGIFIEEMRQGMDHPGAFNEYFELVDAAEAWGVDAVWLGEIHFNPNRSVMCAPLLLASAIAMRTKRLKVGTAVQVLPLNNPLRIAEEVATVDQLSHGRFVFGIGRSGAVRTYDVYGVPYAESQARFREALDIIRTAFTGQAFSYQGHFYQFENVTVSPRPYQVPHPPIRMAATTEDTYPLVGTLGLAMLVGLRGIDIPELAEHIRTYRRAWREAGHAGEGEVYLRIPMYAAPTASAAREEPRESFTYYFHRQAEMMRAALGRAGTGPLDRRRAQAERLAALTYDDIVTMRVAIGTGEQLVDRLAELRERLTLNGLIVELDSGGLIPPDRQRRTFDILANQVIPAFK